MALGRSSSLDADDCCFAIERRLLAEPDEGEDASESDSSEIGLCKDKRPAAHTLITKRNVRLDRKVGWLVDKSAVSVHIIFQMIEGNRTNFCITPSRETPEISTKLRRTRYSVKVA